MDEVLKARLYDRHEAAHRLRISVRTLDRHRQAGRIRAAQIGGRVLYSQQAIDEFIAVAEGRGTAA